MMSMIKPIALKSLAPSSSAFLQWNPRGLIIFRLFFVGALAFFFQTTTTLSAADEFDALRIKWREALIADVTSSKTTSSINSRAVGYQATMLYTITAIKVVNGGSGYTSAPAVQITGGGGSGATATATFSAGKVSAITVVSGGSGYTTTPTVTITGGGGTDAIASPLVAIWSDLPLAAQTGVTADVASGNIADSFKRLEYMAQAYAISGCALYQDATLLTAIAQGLDLLTSNAFTPTGTIFGNWYDWMVSAPQALNNAAILLLSNPGALTTAQIANYVRAVYNYGPDSVNQKDYFWWGALTGANTSNAALSMAVQGILLGSNTTTVTRFWHNTAGHPVNPQTDYVVSGSLLLAEAQGNLSGNNPLDWDGDSVFKPVTSGDGWYADNSFIFHYNIPYTGSYGQELMENIAILVKLLDGSTWEITDPDLSNMYGWITNGTMPLMYRGAMMDMVRGRAIASSSSDQYKVGAAALKNMRSVATFAPADIAAELLAFADSPQVAPGQYHFASMDRVAMHRDGFSFGLSMSSTRVGGYEINTTSPTNLKGWYTGSGVTYLYVENPDTQYMDNYWATVDWWHLPGTTADLSAEADDAVTDQNWAGGAQVNETYGVAGMSAHPAGTLLYAKKSWFMLDDKIVCLGAGITCTGGGQVDTTIENRKLKATGATTFNIADTAYSLTSPATWASPATVSTGTSSTWCALDGVAGYFFPEGGSNLQAQFVSGSGAWTTINPTDSDSTTYTDYYLQIVNKHGVNPTNAKYAYVILPNRKASSVKAYAANPDVTIVSNTQPTSTATGIQAVKSKVLGVVAANFWAKTNGPDNGGTADIITVNKQCSVIVKETANTISVSVSDPTQSNTSTIIVTINGRASLGTLSADPGVTPGSNPITLSVNVNGSKGKSYNASFQLAESPSITSGLTFYGLKGGSLTYQITATQNPVSYDAVGLPENVAVNSATGAITGTPPQEGTYFVTLSATDSAGRTGYATLTLYIGASTADFASTYSSTTSWTCPANVTAVQVEAWGGGGAGGSASRTGGTGTVQYGGGGAGGAYAKTISVPVVPGNTYYINVGTCASNASAVTSNAVAGGDSWFSSSNGPSSLILAKGGAGGNSAVGNAADTAYATAGLATTNGSIGNILYAGGSGANGLSSGAGGGGSGAASTTNGVTATNNVGAVSTAGGGTGGDGVTTGSVAGGSGFAPGGGGGGARNSSGTVSLGGAGGAGQVVITPKSFSGVVAPVAPVIYGNTNLVGVTNRVLSYQITASNNPTYYSASNLPTGLLVNTNTGWISGIPGQTGSFAVTLVASNIAGTGTATLNLKVAGSLSGLIYTNTNSTTWTCPANVTAVQVECWGGGGAGGSGVRGGTNKTAAGGGGAGGAYAKLNSCPVVPGGTYYINVGAGGVSSTNNLATVPGGDSWFNSNNVTSTLVLAKGGAGGQSIVNTNVDTLGTGGAGTTSGSIGNILFAGGSGATSTTNAFGGGGGGSAGTLSAGNAPASTTNGLGAIQVTSGGNGGNANASAASSGNGQSPTGSPGGGGGGARAASATQRYGGTGGAGQIILTVQAIAKAGSTISVTGLTSFTYNGNEQGPDTSTVTGSGGSVSYSYEGVNGTSYPASGTKPTAVGSYRVTATLAADTNYDTATSSAYAFTIVASSTAFASWSGNAAVTSEFVYKYAYGAADKNSAVQEMTSSIVDGKLSLTAVVRTGDPKLVITPKSATSLTGTWSAVDPAIIVTDGDSTGLGTGLFRKVFTVDRAVSLDTKRFLKLEAVYTP
jgi:hyaluronate lyase